MALRQREIGRFSLGEGALAREPLVAPEPRSPDVGGRVHPDTLIHHPLDEVRVQRGRAVRVVEHGVDQHVRAGIQGVHDAGRSRTVNPDQPVRPVPLVHDRPELFDGVRRLVRPGVQRAAAGRHRLDPVGVLLDELTDGVAHALHAVGLAAQRPAVPAGHGDRAAGDREARPPDDAPPERVAQHEADPPERAVLAQGGDARFEGGAGVLGGAQQVDFVGLADELFDGRAVAGKRGVAVAVDQAGQQRALREVEVGGALGGRHGGVRPNIHDPLAVD
jgi:hypothetical protein